MFGVAHVCAPRPQGRYRDLRRWVDGLLGRRLGLRAAAMERVPHPLQETGSSEQAAADQEQEEAEQRPPDDAEVPDVRVATAVEVGERRVADDVGVGLVGRREVVGECRDDGSRQHGADHRPPRLHEGPAGHGGPAGRGR